MATILGEDTDGLVKTSRYKLLSSGRIVNIKHSRDVVHVHCDRLLQVPHVVCVQADEKRHPLLKKSESFYLLSMYKGDLSVQQFA